MDLCGVPVRKCFCSIFCRQIYGFSLEGNDVLICRINFFYASCYGKKFESPGCVHSGSLGFWSDSEIYPADPYVNGVFRRIKQQAVTGYITLHISLGKIIYAQL